MKQFPCTLLAVCLLVARVASMCSDEQQEAATNNFKVRYLETGNSVQYLLIIIYSLGDSYFTKRRILKCI